MLKGLQIWKMVELERMDWEQVKKTVTEELRSHMLGIIINKKILEVAEKEIKKCPTVDMTKAGKKNTRSAKCYG